MIDYNPAPDHPAHAGDPQALRQMAEAMTRGGEPLTPAQIAAMSSTEVLQVLHELQVHQIELELQNEELRQAHEQLEVSRSRYFDLYHLAPVGYCTISGQGLILTANLTASTLLAFIVSKTSAINLGTNSGSAYSIKACLLSRPTTWVPFASTFQAPIGL